MATSGASLRRCDPYEDEPGALPYVGEAVVEATGEEVVVALADTGKQHASNVTYSPSQHAVSPDG